MGKLRQEPYKLGMSEKDNGKRGQILQNKLTYS